MTKPKISSMLSFKHLGRMWRAERSKSSQGLSAEMVRTHGSPMSELLPWMFPIGDQLVVCKDSGILACFAFEGLDADSSSDEQINTLSYHAERAMSGMASEPLVYWWQVRRRRTTDWPIAAFTHSTSASLDDSRREGMKLRPQFKNTHYLSVLLRAPLGSQNLSAQLSHIATEGRIESRSKFATALRMAKVLLTTFNPLSAGGNSVFAYYDGMVFEAAERFESNLKSFVASMPGLDIRRLKGGELGLYLEQSCSLATPVRGHGLPDPHSFCGPFMDEFMGCDDVGIDEDDPSVLRIKGDGLEPIYAKALTLRDWPQSSCDDEGRSRGGVAPGSLDKLLQIDGEIVITLVARSMEKTAAQSFVEAARRYHNNRKYSVRSLVAAALKQSGESNAPVNTARARAAFEANELASDISMNLVQLLHGHYSVLCLGDTHRTVELLVDKVIDVAKAANFGKVFREDMHLLSSFTAHIPGSYQPIARWTPLTSSNIADVAPLRTIATGNLKSAYLSEHMKCRADAAVVLPTNYRTPYYFDLFANVMGHGFFVGPTRAGKTVMMLLIASGFLRYGRSQVICLDKDLSCRVCVVTQGGSYAMLDPESQDSIQINPFCLLRESRHRQWLISWIELVVSQRGFVVKTEHSKEIEEALRALAALETDQHHFSGFYSHVTHPELKDELRVWVRDEQGALSKYFDNEIDGFNLSQLCGFELGKVLTNEQVSAPFTDYLFYRIDQMLLSQRETGVVFPTMVIIPEVWNLLKNPTYAAKIVDWLKTFAKRHAALWMDTQSVEDLSESGIFPAIRDNVPNTIFAANSRASSRSARSIYVDELGLKDEQVQLIAQAVPRRDFLLRQGEIVRSIELTLNNFELSVLRSDTNAQSTLDRHKRSGNPDFINAYIEEMLHD
jgi:type IV secretion system protein TrbE